MTPLTRRFAAAVALATDAHAAQTRKGTATPYIGHLLAVASVVIEAGGEEDVVIAALLHDALEDTDVTYDVLVERFGAEVARIVRACSDTEVQPKPPWRERKEAHLRHLADADERVLLVTLGDKLHNAASLRRDVARHGPSYLERFNAPAAEQLWYHRSMATLLRDRLTLAGALPFVADYGTEVERLHALLAED